MNHGHPHKPSTATSATSNYGAVHPRRISLELKSAPPRPQQQLPSSSRSWHSRLEWAVFYSTELDFFSFLLPLDFLDIGYFLLPFFVSRHYHAYSPFSTKHPSTHSLLIVCLSVADFSSLWLAI